MKRAKAKALDSRPGLESKALALELESKALALELIEMKFNIRRYFSKRIKLLVVLLILFSLAGDFGTLHWILELTSHFKLQYLLLLLGCVLILLWMRWWWWALLSFLGVVLNAMVVLPWYFQQVPVTSASHDLKLLLANVNFKNKNYSALPELVATEKPTILIVQEGNRHWVKHLKGLFPYQLVPPKSHFFGTSIFSHLPFEQTQVLPLGSQMRESLHIKVKVNNKIISLVTTHPFPPIRQYFFEQRNHQLLAVKSYLQSLSNPKIFIGDLNLSMWSPFYLILLGNIGLVNARQGFGLLPTYPMFLPIFMIPIDHCLVSSDIKVVNIRTSYLMGSDHLPLIVKLAIQS
jgi:endonuclease/exonuclease/phosphatase (EEP) superfamily protein YafD